MKKAVSTLLALVCVICFAFAFAGCGGNQTDGEEERKEIEGGFMNLYQAYDFGVLHENDLKSIACRYYDGYTEDNPYEGMYAQDGALKEQTEKEIKLAYLQKIVNEPNGSLEKVTISNYYGTYDGNVVVGIYSGYDSSSSLRQEMYEQAEIGGVVFRNFWKNGILTFTDAKIPKYETSGVFYTLTSGAANGLIGESDLKSISCGYYERLKIKYPYADLGENLYEGLYEKPAEELSSGTKNEIKQAYAEQVLNLPEASLLDVEITYFYGIYNGNAVVEIEYKNSLWQYGQQKPAIGGVEFKNYSDGYIWLFRKS